MTYQAENITNFRDDISSHCSRRSPLHHLYLDSFMGLESLEEGPTSKRLKLLPKSSRSATTLFPINDLSSPRTERSDYNAPIQDTSDSGDNLSPSTSNSWLWSKDESEEIDRFSPNTVQYPLEMQTTNNCGLLVTPMMTFNPDGRFCHGRIGLQPKTLSMEAVCDSDIYPSSNSARFDEIEYLDFISSSSESLACASIYLPSLES